MKKLNQKGFTLIEMMIVLVIVSILTLFIIPNAAAYISKANTQGCESYEKSLDAQQAAAEFLGDDFETNEALYNEICKE